LEFFCLGSSDGYEIELKRGYWEFKFYYVRSEANAMQRVNNILLKEADRYSSRPALPVTINVKVHFLLFQPQK